MVCHQLCAWGENKEQRSGRNAFAESHQGLSLNSARGCFHAFNSQSNELFIFVADKVPFLLLHPFFPPCQNKKGGLGKRKKWVVFQQIWVLIIDSTPRGRPWDRTWIKILNNMHLQYKCYAFLYLIDFEFLSTELLTVFSLAGRSPFWRDASVIKDRQRDHFA